MNFELLTDEEKLRYHFEKATSESWGWDNFRRDTDGSYISSRVQAAWKCFEYGVKVGKKIAGV